MTTFRERLTPEQLKLLNTPAPSRNGNGQHIPPTWQEFREVWGLSVTALAGVLKISRSTTCRLLAGNNTRAKHMTIPEADDFMRQCNKDQLARIRAATRVEVTKRPGTKSAPNNSGKRMHAIRAFVEESDLSCNALSKNMGYSSAALAYALRQKVVTDGMWDAFREYRAAWRKEHAPKAADEKQRDATAKYAASLARGTDELADELAAAMALTAYPAAPPHAPAADSGLTLTDVLATAGWFALGAAAGYAAAVWL